MAEKIPVTSATVKVSDFKTNNCEPARKCSLSQGKHLKMETIKTVNYAKNIFCQKHQVMKRCDCTVDKVDRQ